MNRIILLLGLFHVVKSNEWKFLETKLPKPLSDMTATYAEFTSKIYIFGGCDSLNGNERASFDPTLFICGKVTDSAYAFDPMEESFVGLTSMPRERYRHSASLVNGKIWVVGGRNLEDEIVLEVDVYDPTTNTWETPTTLPSAIGRSDFGMFSVKEYLYLVGGYDSQYTAWDSTFRLNTETFVVTELDMLKKGRGDIFALRLGGYAYVTGGFSHENNFCQSLNTTERYDIDNDEWSHLGVMNQNRGDQAVVGWKDALFVIGGEYKTDCQGDPAEFTSASDEVDVMLHPSRKNPTWKKLDDIPDDRFRFVGEVFSETDTIYLFGGQKFFDPDCSCYATSDKVLAYSVTDDTFKSAASSINLLFNSFIVFGSLAFAFLT